ncbi:MAG: hypothetical protein ACIAXF_03385 [Phycisphaerales bacterium JB063]
MNTTKTVTPQPTMSRAVAPEDVRVGDYITVTHKTYQLIPIDLLDTYTPNNDVLQPQTIRLIPDDAGVCHRVVAVCLPFILTRTATGGHSTLDVRQQTLRRLDKRFGKAAFRAMKPKKPKDKSAQGRCQCGKRNKDGGKGKGKDPGGDENGA